MRTIYKRAYFIDSMKKQITEIRIESKDELKSLRLCVGGSIEAAVILENNDVIYVDEEGLFKNPQHFFISKGHHQPLAGNGVLIGTDVSNGESIDAVTEIKWLRENIIFMDKAEAVEFANQMEEV